MDYDADYALVVKVGDVVAGEVLNTLGRMEGTKGASVQLRARTEVGTGERLVSVGLVQLYTLREMLFAEPQTGRRP